jgi:hypothetical protein
LLSTADRLSRVYSRLYERCVTITTMAAVTVPPWTAALFRPTNRLRDLLREQRGNDSFELPRDLAEVELIPDLSPQHVLATAGITYENFCDFLGDDKLVWMGPDVYVCYGCDYEPRSHHLVVEIGSWNPYDHGPYHPSLHVYAATESETTAAMATCDFAVRLLATMEENGTFIEGYLSQLYFNFSKRAMPIFEKLC